MVNLSFIKVTDAHTSNTVCIQVNNILCVECHSCSKTACVKIGAGTEILTIHTAEKFDDVMQLIKQVACVY